MVNHDKLKILEILTTDEGSKLIKEGSDDIDIDDSDSDSVCNSGTSGTSRSTSNLTRLLLVNLQTVVNANRTPKSSTMIETRTKSLSKSTACAQASSMTQYSMRCW
jgi:hypothetical protein